MPFELSIVTPEGTAFQDRVSSVVLPGTEGQFGVLPGHVRFLTPLAIGEAVIQTTQGSRYAALSDGFAEVRQDHVVVMVETCEFGSSIDVARAERAKARAEAAIAASRQSTHDENLFRIEEAALRRALNRIAAAKNDRQI
ncbi:MAG: ATP synthase F1 subunit epsilon [Deltaproteobacteria bacterium]|nr:ATP synthase F1 subunit epsilon [Deltaproteobacteria bacterium]